MSRKFNSSEALIEAIGQGQMVVLLDDEDRENEGDLVMAAEFVKAEHINFMAKHARGLICLTLTGERCQQLGLSLMSQNNLSPYGTNFTVSIEAAEGVTTGISAADRAKTVQAAIAPDAKATDLRQPGHVFPIMARSGGVLSRAGHTEAGCDLAMLAGVAPAAVIVEIMNEDGTMARRADLEAFAKKHSLKIGTIADLIHYRSVHDKTVERVLERPLSTAYGDFQLVVYQSTIDESLHYALVNGAIEADKASVVRVHIQDPLFDVLGVEAPDTRWPLGDALKYVKESEAGVVLILTEQHSQKVLLNRLKPDVEKGDGVVDDIRLIGTGSQILADLGVGKMRLLSTPRKYHALSGFRLEVEEYVGWDAG